MSGEHPTTPTMAAWLGYPDLATLKPWTNLGGAARLAGMTPMGVLRAVQDGKLKAQRQTSGGKRDTWKIYLADIVEWDYHRPVNVKARAPQKDPFARPAPRTPHARARGSALLCPFCHKRRVYLQKHIDRHHTTREKRPPSNPTTEHPDRPPWGSGGVDGHFSMGTE